MGKLNVRIRRRRYRAKRAVKGFEEVLFRWAGSTEVLPFRPVDFVAPLDGPLVRAKVIPEWVGNLGAS